MTAILDFARSTWARYLLVSGFALAADIGSFLLLLDAGAPTLVASAAGYSLGIVVHWAMSSRAVFADAVAEKGAARTRQQAQFFGSALAGLGITQAIVGVAADAPRREWRCRVAVAVSFQLTYLLRRRVVFA